MSQDAGKLYEEKINAILKKNKLQPIGFTHNSNDNSNPDSVFIRNGVKHGIEVKHTDKTTYGAVRIIHDGRRWKLNSTDKIATLLKADGVETAINNHFRDKPVPFLFQTNGRRSMTDAQIEYDMKEFGGEGNYIYVPLQNHVAASYYKSKDVNYIQIQHCGFFHFGKNPAGVKAPKIQFPKLQAEFRMKAENKKNGQKYYSFVVQIKMTQKITLMSPSDIDKSVDFLL